MMTRLRRTIANCPYEARQLIPSRTEQQRRGSGGGGGGISRYLRPTSIFMCGCGAVTAVIVTLLVLHSLSMIDGRRECVLDALERYKKPLDWRKVFTSVQRVTTPMHNQAYVCIATENYFARGCSVVLRSLYRTGTVRDMLVLVTAKVSAEWRTRLVRLGGVVKEVATIAGSLKPLHEETMIKLRLWQQTQYSKVVFIDADTIVLKNLDALFDLPEFSATYDPFNVYYYDGRILNSALFVAEPSLLQFDKLMAHLKAHKHYMTRNIGDGNIFNEFFPNWTKIHSSYLIVSHLFDMGKYRNRLLEAGKIIHFSGTKPYFSGWMKGTSSCKSYSSFLLYAWDMLFDEAVRVADGQLDPQVMRFDFPIDTDV